MNSAGNTICQVVLDFTIKKIGFLSSVYAIEIIPVFELHSLVTFFKNVVLCKSRKLHFYSMSKEV